MFEKLCAIFRFCLFITADKSVSKKVKNLRRQNDKIKTLSTSFLIKWHVICVPSVVSFYGSLGNTVCQALQRTFQRDGLTYWKFKVKPQIPCFFFFIFF